MEAILARPYDAHVRRRATHPEGEALLAAVPQLATVLGRHGPMALGSAPPVAARFEAVARTIAHQQLAGAAAASIWARVRALVDGPFDAVSVSALPPGALRGAGLSGAKAAAVADLARQCLEGTVRLDRLGHLGDDEVVTELIRVRGVGPWTAHMVLLFTLRRRDVWPTGDLGVRAGYARLFGIPVPAPVELEGFGEPFRPYRSVLAWYCWRALDDRG